MRGPVCAWPRPICNLHVRMYARHNCTGTPRLSISLATHASPQPHTHSQMDEVLAGVADQIKNFAVVFLVDVSEVPDFNTMYELYDPCTTMFFFR